jgi:3-vinyl bacteriochlorophyllide hydratase
MHPNPSTAPRKRLYTDEERARRDSTRWTLVQGLLAPAQFVAFAVSLILVLRFLMSGDGYTAATVSITPAGAIKLTVEPPLPIFAAE